MDEHDWLVDRFEEHRTHLRAVAYRMLGSLSEADDAVQEAWLRLSRADTSEVENLGGWLTRSAWRCWWSSRRWSPPSGWRWCCTTCSRCRSTRSLPSWEGHRRRRDSSRAGPVAGCRAPPFPTPT